MTRSFIAKFSRISIGKNRQRKTPASEDIFPAIRAQSTGTGLSFYWKKAGMLHFIPAFLMKAFRKSSGK
jgi:hypothetical protein